MKARYSDIVEAIYRDTRKDLDWLGGIAEVASRKLDAGLGVSVYSFDASDAAHLKIHDIANTGTLIASLEPQRNVNSALSSAHVRAAYAPSPRVQLLSECFGDLNAHPKPRFLQMMQDSGIVDAIGVRGTDPDLRGCVLTVPLARTQRLPPRTRHTLSRIGAHLASGWRLRRATTASGSRGEESADLIFTPTGKLEHRSEAFHSACNDLRMDTKAAESRLMDTALLRGQIRRRRSSDEEGLSLWTALVSGLWSVVDYVDRDGKRFILARRNEMSVNDPIALGARERQVAAYVALGHSNKFVAYELGLAPSTIAAHLAGAMRKLGCRSRRELVQIIGPASERSPSSQTA